MAPADAQPGKPDTASVPVPAIVLDTNIVLDLLVFADPATPPLRAALAAGALRWIGTPVMRDELERVLAYTHLVPRLQYYATSAGQVLAQWDAQVQLQPVAPRARFACKDADDQKFIDLAVAHQALLLSKDRAVLSMARRLRTLGVETSVRLDMLSAPDTPPAA